MTKKQTSEYKKALANLWSATARKAVTNAVTASAGFVSYIRVITNTLAILWIDSQEASGKRYPKDDAKGKLNAQTLWENGIATMKLGFIENIATGDLAAFTDRTDAYTRTFLRIAHHKGAMMYLPLWAEGNYETTMYTAEQELNSGRKSSKNKKPTTKAGRWVKTWENADDKDKTAMIQKLIQHKDAGTALRAAFTSLNAAARSRKSKSSKRGRKTA